MKTSLVTNAISYLTLTFSSDWYQKLINIFYNLLRTTYRRYTVASKAISFLFSLLSAKSEYVLRQISYVYGVQYVCVLTPYLIVTHSLQCILLDYIHALQVIVQPLHSLIMYIHSESSQQHMSVQLINN
jgi:hypothetical protein